MKRHFISNETFKSLSTAVVLTAFILSYGLPGVAFADNLKHLNSTSPIPGFSSSQVIEREAKNKFAVQSKAFLFSGSTEAGTDVEVIGPTVVKEGESAFSVISDARVMLTHEKESPYDLPNGLTELLSPEGGVFIYNKRQDKGKLKLPSGVVKEFEGISTAMLAAEICAEGSSSCIHIMSTIAILPGQEIIGTYTKSWTNDMGTIFHVVVGIIGTASEAAAPNVEVDAGVVSESPNDDDLGSFGALMYMDRLKRDNPCGDNASDPDPSCD